MNLPAELSKIFSENSFVDYPLVKIPQVFTDSRGTIANIADGNLGDVAIIESNKNAVRANHYHELDWHLSYLVSGRMIYTWKSIEPGDSAQNLEITAGQLFYTPPRVIHRMQFLTESIFVAVSKLNRDKESYESDTVRVQESKWEI
jgi:dTDP-4-dehydrorhamnose 3,5-epimerase-like enzyme